MHKYKLRAECFRDIQRFLDLVLANSDQQLGIVIDFATLNNGGRLPSATLELETDLTLAQLSSLLNEVPDSHVMRETIAPADQYTGERR